MLRPPRRRRPEKKRRRNDTYICNIIAVLPRSLVSRRRGNDIKTRPRQLYGEDSYLQYYPLILYSIVPLVASTLYTFLAKALNEFEEHPTSVRKKNALVIKVLLQ